MNSACRILALRSFALNWKFREYEQISCSTVLSVETYFEEVSGEFPFFYESNEETINNKRLGSLEGER
ncbi:MAG TPA: hypothetical protein EYQ50_07245 [Verrucomicrobiales bacterium]|jgi:hypothetical protein|nr:hypothetical protein [Verrucomicrobiales bacterium]